jgi:ABC-type multidrug transport system fused ATPase/permease subunit
MKNTKLNIESNEKILEVLNSYREAVVRNRRFFYAKSVGDLRYELANTQAEVQFMPNISKYVIESSVVLGALVLSAAQFMLEDASHAVATLAVFLAAGTRIAPAILRIQQGAITIRGSLGSASSTLELIEELSDAKVIEETQAEVQVDHTGFQAEVRIENVSLTYPGNPKKAVNSASIIIEPGSVVALVGPSGAGKTSLVDLILGVLIPDTGIIEISGESPGAAINKWPGALAYVPQDVVITQGSINENVALGFPINSASDSLVKRALDIAQLSDFVSNLPNGIDTDVGERGTKISGGQRQRLGIARALYTQPKLLVLDEATSALDGQTEADISGAIHKLKGNTTVIMIAHRLSTVRNADKVVYMDEGKIVAVGTFDEVKTLVPDFDSQAALMGL